MPHVIAVVQTKGSMGKSALAAEIVAELHQRGESVLAIDLDPQRTLCQRLGLKDSTDPAASSRDYIDGEGEAAAIATPSPALPGVDIMEAARTTDDIDPTTVTMLRDRLPDETAWNYVVIDTPGHVSDLVACALIAADTVAIPIGSENEALNAQLLFESFRATRVARLRRRKGPATDVYVPSRWDRSTLQCREALAAIENRYPGQVTPPIHSTVHVTESYLDRKPYSVYDPKNPTAVEFRTAAAQVIDATTN